MPVWDGTVPRSRRAPAEHTETSLAPRTRSPKRLEPQNRVHKGSPWHKLKRLWKKKPWSRNRSRNCNRCQDTRSVRGNSKTNWWGARSFGKGRVDDGFQAGDRHAEARRHL